MKARTIDAMAECNNVDVINNSLKALQTLRTSVSTVFEQLRDGMNTTSITVDKEKAFLSDLRKQLNSVNDNLSAVEKQASLLAGCGASGSLGNLGLLSLEPIIDKQPVFSQLLQSYKWSGKVQEYAQHSSSLLQANTLKRTHTGAGLPPAFRRQRKPTPVSHVAPSASVDVMLENIERHFSNNPIKLTIKKSRPMGSPTFIEISIGRVLRALVVLRGLLVEHVCVKAYNEDFIADNGKIDIWSKSKHHVFRKISEHTTAAILHFHYPIAPDIAVRSFITWLHSYHSLFSATCVKCERHLVNNLPPTWRDYFQLQAYHECCKP